MKKEIELRKLALQISEEVRLKCLATIKIINHLIENEFGDTLNIDLQGSFKNKTFINQESDIDILVGLKDSFDFSKYYFNGIISKDEYSEAMYSENKLRIFKKILYNLLREYFKFDVIRKNKCIHIKENKNLVKTDIVPCIIFRHNILNEKKTIEGIIIQTDDDESIISFPKQHFENIIFKDNLTNNKFKKLVRIFKNCKSELIKNHEIDENIISSFMIESLLWNVPNKIFNCSDSYLEITFEIFLNIYEDLKNLKLKNYKEVNGLKKLFSYDIKGKNEDLDNVILFLINVYELIFENKHANRR